MLMVIHGDIWSGIATLIVMAVLVLPIGGALVILVHKRLKADVLEEALKQERSLNNTLERRVAALENESIHQSEMVKLKDTRITELLEENKQLRDITVELQKTVSKLTQRITALEGKLDREQNRGSEV